MHMGKAVLLWIRPHMLLSAKMQLMLIAKKKTPPLDHARLTRYKLPHQKTHPTALIA